MSVRYKILGVDSLRAQQNAIARAFSQADCLYRFIVEPAKLLSAVNLFHPDALLLHGELSSELLGDTLDTLYSNPSFSHLPIALLCSDTEDETFLQGFRTGVVALLREPFSENHVSHLTQLLETLPSRPGISSGISDSRSLARLAEHLRKTRRSGSLTVSDDKGTVANAEFEVGKLSLAQYHELHGLEALINLVTMPKATWVVKERPHTQTTTPPEPKVASENAEPPVDAQALLDLRSQMNETSSEEPVPFELPLHVLLADGDSLFTQKFALAFQKHSIHITPAKNGVEAYHLALTGKFDIALCSLNLGGVDGWGALGLIREDFRTKELPVVLMADDEETCEWLQTSEIGADAYASRLMEEEPLRHLLYRTLLPRHQLSKHLEQRENLLLSLGEMGPQWLIRTLKTLQFSGCIEANTDNMQLQLFFSNGEAVYAAAQSGNYSAEAEIAFNAFISLKQPTEAKLLFEAASPATNLSLSTEVMLVRAALTLNENENRKREKAFAKAKRVEVRPNLYVLFQKFGPKAHLPWISLICESKLTPKEVLARANISPLQLDEIVGDLVRRRVIRLTP
ncbi:MAG: response regulator [Proteobacteria bacterium]|nr:response regulator [Cystobacterineae bacterium]MCL2259129.1 response regulator [Cystobacterineae bacterium]MCL2315298.1 response regulator [Pseudomonadota bacterium]